MKKFPLSQLLSKYMPKLNEPLSLIVVDDAEIEASEIFTKVKIPKTLSLHGMKKAYLFSNLILSKLKGTDIRIVEKKNLTKDEAYQLNVNIFQHLIDQRDAFVSLVQHMVQPLIENVAGVNIELSNQNKRVTELENQLKEYQKNLKAAFGKAPSIPPIPNSKQLWKASMVDASKEIIKNFRADKKANTKQYKDLRDASDEFFDLHEFKHKQDYTKDLLYANVKKEKMMTPE
jgi:hypothetical protein